MKTKTNKAAKVKAVLPAHWELQGKNWILSINKNPKKELDLTFILKALKEGRFSLQLVRSTRL